MTVAALEIDQLGVEFAVRRRRLHAVRGVTLHVHPGEAYGLVGESGSGKTTIGRAVLGLIEPTTGSIRLHGRDLHRRRSLAERRAIQVVFQDPLSSLNPRRTIESVLGELLRRFERVDGTGRTAVGREVAALLERVGLPAEFASRHPAELSGGQRQRVAIARALAPGPDVIVCDEALSALDVSTQERIIEVLLELQATTKVAFLFIAHDLPVVRRLADRIGVMYLGQLVEQGDAERVALDPRHPYTQSLFAASPVPDPARQKERRAMRRRLHITGEPPSPLDPPAGCAFHPRCPVAIDRCRHEPPADTDIGDGWTARCHLVGPSPAATVGTSHRGVQT